MIFLGNLWHVNCIVGSCGGRCFLGIVWFNGGVRGVECCEFGAGVVVLIATWFRSKLNLIPFVRARGTITILIPADMRFIAGGV